MCKPLMLKLLEASELTGLSYDFLRKRCLDGTLVHIRAGRTFYVNRIKLEEYLNAGETTPTDGGTDE